MLGGAPQDVVFTSGGTEADNLAVKGLAWAGAEDGGAAPRDHRGRAPGRARDRQMARPGHGFELTEVPPDRDGTVDPDRVPARSGPTRRWSR